MTERRRFEDELGRLRDLVEDLGIPLAAGSVIVNALESALERIPSLERQLATARNTARNVAERERGLVEAQQGEPGDVSRPAAQLTRAEFAVLDMLADVINAINALPVCHQSDYPELVPHFHAIQEKIMARAAVRAHPDFFRAEENFS